MVGLSVHESGGGGYLVLSRRVVRETTTWAHASAPRWGETWVRSIKIPRFLAVLGGTGILPRAALACVGGTLGVEFRGSLAPFFFSTSINKKKSILTYVWSNPPNKNAEKWSGQLKFELTDLGPHLHKITGQFFNWPKRVAPFNGINYQSHAKVLCTFKLNSQCHDSVPLMALWDKS